MVKELKESVQDAREIYPGDRPRPRGRGDRLAPGPGDRRRGSKPIRRVVFHEITPDAVTEAMPHPREIDMDLVDAQQARRVLDRLVGYGVSPLLWKKVKRGLSAGRVQTAALRIVVERERRSWPSSRSSTGRSRPTWRKRTGRPPAREGHLPGRPAPESHGKKAELQDRRARRRPVVDRLDGADLPRRPVTKRETQRRPSAPFTTSTLAAGSIAQARLTGPADDADRAGALRGRRPRLRRAPQGLITYMRTDSTNVVRVGAAGGPGGDQRQVRSASSCRSGRPSTRGSPRARRRRTRRSARRRRSAIRRASASSSRRSSSGSTS